MNHKQLSDQVVLAVFPSARGFGYVVFEGPQSLIDWGVKGARGNRKNARSLQRVRELLAFYCPDLLVLEDYEAGGSRRGKRIRQLIDAIAVLSEKEGMARAFFSRADVRNCFGLIAKRQIAEVIARDFPELEPRLPPVRKIWMSEDARMNIFDAAALAVTFFHTKGEKKQAA